MAHSPGRGPKGPVNVTLTAPSADHPTLRSLDSGCRDGVIQVFLLILHGGILSMSIWGQCGEQVRIVTVVRQL